jgi:DNA-binding transcriptional regulator YdaS (Cro superfamily)
MNYWPKIEKQWEGNLAAFGRDIGVSRQLVNLWKRQGYVPAKYATKLQQVTGGKVSAMEVVLLANRKLGAR